MNYFTKILLITFTFIKQIYSNNCDQNIDLNIPYQQQNISVDNPLNIHQKNGFLNLILTNNNSNSTFIRLDNKIQYGRIDVTMKVANGNSIVSTFSLYSDETNDEVNFEFVQNSNFPNRIETNLLCYNPNYANELSIYSGTELAYSFNKYTLISDVNFYEWRFNDNFIRRTYKNETDKYPESLTNLKISIREHEESVWSGPSTNWDDAPFILSISSIKVRCVGNSQNTKTTTSLQLQTTTKTSSPSPTTTSFPIQTTTSLKTKTSSPSPTTTSFPINKTSLPLQTTTFLQQTPTSEINKMTNNNGSSSLKASIFFTYILFISEVFVVLLDSFCYY
jgi:beta-glucanase (GH16 family)